MIVYWSFNPILLELGPLSIRWYGLLFVGGFIVGQQLLGRMFRSEGIDARIAENLLLYALVGAIVGARLVHCFVYEPMYYMQHPFQVLRVWEGGLASHGGIVGLAIGLILAARRQSPPLSVVWLFDRVTIPALLAATAIRVANFLNSEIVGNPTSGGWGIVFESVDQVARHPVQLYEASAYFCIALMLWMMYRKGVGARSGFLLGITLILVFSSRIIIEIFKTPQASYDGALLFSAGQLLSVPFIIFGISLIWRATKAANITSKPKPLRRMS
ncbi:prolipoprotein diacylglyceryl transferase [Rheinheimera soli]|uniref:Phosphatidylglycerol--prolipoprotein diacylglyceryl transferase n=1 Tax=Rheinheimera soli TaxID=443616 RepID=A0ABU1W2M1_9GAMM|nr:prolipoprotein diacylglyceryl transferase [Rheinheimera soli]MDR7121973.1 prolipoprotein diacylglyceryl transferase [Rheinheimera soli]